jgi:tetratricopeptide (TPR) repeat protein
MEEEERVDRLLEAHRFSDVERLCRKALRDDATRSRLWFALGESLRARGRLAAAWACYDRASILDPRWEWDDATKRQRGLGTPGSMPPWLAQLLQVPRVSLAGAMIARDEAATIAQAIAALTPAVDRVVVVDTGSRDATVSLAEAAGAEVLNVPWQDHFGDARNAALDAIRADWVLWVDADELLDPEDIAVPRTAAGLFHRSPVPPVLRVVQVNYIAGAVERSFEIARLFPTDRGLRWRGRIHEQVTVDPARGTGPPVSPVVRIRLHHVGYEPDVMARRGKLARNIRLLKQAVAEDPSDVASWGFLGRELYFAGELEDARDALQRAEALAAVTPTYARLPEVRTYLAEVLLRLNRVDDALAVAEQLVADTPDYPTGWFVRGQASIRLAVAYLARARQSFEQAGERARRYQGSLGVDAALGDWKAALGSADVAKLEGRWDEAVRLYTLARSRMPDPGPVDRQLDTLRAVARAVAGPDSGP